MHQYWLLCSLSFQLLHFCTTAALVQKPLGNSYVDLSSKPRSRPLQGRFLHITDLHPDPFYQVGSATDAAGACHRGKGAAGYYGAESTECDAPFSLINATFEWIKENLEGKIDFVIWTGDSARHDNDEQHPRNEAQVLGLNTYLVEKFEEVFGQSEKGGRRGNDRFQIPIIPSFGNNDVLPHNIFPKGPNIWTKRYARLWKDIIPEEQRHAFDRGGWFYVEVIPNRLAVFSLNTLYFFGSNSAVDGCASRDEPGYEQLEWLRIQLGFLRLRGMKAILSGHVPPARSAEKSLWDESCWQKYAIWLRQYRDVVVGSLYGHMNVEHFILQDFHDIDYDIAGGAHLDRRRASEQQEGEITVQINAANYLKSLHHIWANLPSLPMNLQRKTSLREPFNSEQRGSKDRHEFFDEIGGQFAERFSVSLVAASVVPNYLPALRVFEYNITGLEALDGNTIRSQAATGYKYDRDILNTEVDSGTQDVGESYRAVKRKRPHFTIPEPPPKRSPPGPAYSPQSLSLVGYTQYYANLTQIHNIANHLTSSQHDVYSSRRPNQPDNHQPRRSIHDSSPNFTFQVEYDTKAGQDLYSFGREMTVQGWVTLAATLGDWKPGMDDDILRDDKSSVLSETKGQKQVALADVIEDNDEEDYDEEKDDKALHDHDFVAAVDVSQFHLNTKEHKKKKKKKHKHKKEPNKERKREIVNAWYTFASRAVVGTLSEDELKEKFGQ